MFCNGRVVQTCVKEGYHGTIAQLYRVVRAYVIRGEKKDNVRAIHGYFKARKVYQGDPKDGRVIARTRQIARFVTYRGARNVARRFVQRPCSSYFKACSANLRYGPFLGRTRRVVPPRSIHFRCLAQAKIRSEKTRNVNFNKNNVNRRKMIRIVLVRVRTIHRLPYGSNVLRSNAFGDDLPVLSSLLSVFPPAAKDKILSMRRGQFNQFRRFATGMALPIFQFQFRAPTNSRQFLICALLAIAMVWWQVDGVACAQAVRASRRQFLQRRRREKASFSHGGRDHYSLDRLDYRLKDDCRVILGDFSEWGTKRVLSNQDSRISVHGSVVSAHLHAVVGVISLSRCRNEIVVRYLCLRTNCRQEGVVVRCKLPCNVLIQYRQGEATLACRRLINDLIRFGARRLVFMVHAAIRAHLVRFKERALWFVCCRRVASRRPYQRFGMVVTLLLMGVRRSLTNGDVKADRFFMITLKLGTILNFALLFLARPSRDFKEDGVEYANVRRCNELARRCSHGYRS